MVDDIKFGTDGWRAIIADHYTFENVGIVTQAVARWLIDEEITQNGVVIGYDARFLSRKFAEHAASVFAAMEVPVRMSDAIVPTPAVSAAAKHLDAVGVVITASHNPPEWNGYKIKAPFGGSASPDQIAGIEEKLNHYDPSLQPNAFSGYLHNGMVRELNLLNGYLDLIRDSIDLDTIRSAGIRIAHDPMFGSGSTVLKELLGESSMEIHGERNPLFGGIAPEPMEKNLKELSDTILEHECDAGIANDGDADRVGMVDEEGKFVDSHRILSLLAKYLYEKKGLEGTIVKTFSTTTMLDKQAVSYGLPLEVTPIGFKYIAEKIRTGDVLVGGEESGGIAVKGYLPERDGIYIGLLVAEMMATYGKPLSELVQDLFEEFGMHAYYRNDLHTEERKKRAMIDYCRSKNLTQIAGIGVKDWDFTDGIKHLMEDGSWLLVRPSGTEPVLRIYAEADTREKAVSLVKDATQWVDKPEILR